MLCSVVSLAIQKNLLGIKAYYVNILISGIVRHSVSSPLKQTEDAASFERTDG
jgi:hypothetical protein